MLSWWWATSRWGSINYIARQLETDRVRHMIAKLDRPTIAGARTDSSQIKPEEGRSSQITIPKSE